MSEEYPDVESWREEYLRLRRQIFSYDEDFDVFDCLKLNLKDIRYAGTLRKGKIQRDEDTFNRDLERNEIFSQLQLMKKEIETLKSKIQENNPRLQGYYRSEISKMKKKAEEFMTYHGGNFTFMEEEHQGLEEYLKKFEEENILQQNRDENELEQRQAKIQANLNSSTQSAQKQKITKSHKQDRNNSENDQDSQLESYSKDDIILKKSNYDDIRQENQKKDLQNISKTVPIESNNIDGMHDEEDNEHEDTVMLTSPRNLKKVGQIQTADYIKSMGKEGSSQQDNSNQGIPSVNSSVLNSRIPSSHPKGGVFSPRSNSHYSGSPQQRSVYDTPVDLDSNPKEDEKDLNQLRDCVKKLDAMIEQNGGRNCGWTEEDHNKFTHLYKKYGGKQGLLLSRAASVDGAISVLKFHTDEDILKHIQLFEQNLRLNEQKSQFITDYRSLMVRLTKRRQAELQIVNQLRQQRAIKGLKERIQSTVKYTQHQAEQLERAKKYYRDVVSGTTREYQETVLKREQEVLNRLERQQLEREELYMKQAKKNEQNIYQVRKLAQNEENRVKQQEEEQIQLELEQETRIRRGLEDKAASNLRISAAERNIQIRLQQLENLKQQKPKHPSSSYKYYTPQIKRKQISTPLSHLLQA